MVIEGPSAFSPWRSRTVLSCLKASTRVSNALSQVALPFMYRMVFSVSVTSSPKGSALWLGCDGGVVAGSFSAGGEEGGVAGGSFWARNRAGAGPLGACDNDGPGASTRSDATKHPA